MSEINIAVGSPALQGGTNAKAPAAPKIDAPHQATFLGNSVDLTSLIALASGVLVLITCLTCGSSFYCLPVIPLALGILGLVLARNSVDPKRTRLWSWIGIGGGGVAVLVAILAIVGYFFFILMMILLSQGH